MTLGELLRQLPSLGDGNEMKVWLLSPFGQRFDIAKVDIKQDCIEISALRVATREDQ